MTRRAAARLWRTTRWPRKRSDPKGLILCYHRVAKLRSDPWGLSVAPGRFAKHLEILRRRARPLRLRQLHQALLDGKVPDRSVVVTFDDGYADNLYNAKSLLERYDVPATVFLTSGFIGQEREFWWDELERIFLQPGTLPERLSLRLSLSGSGGMYRWELGKAAHYTKWAFQQHLRWRAGKEAPSIRHSIYETLWGLLYHMIEGERRKVLDELLRWAGLEPSVRPSHSSLSFEEVVALSKGELIEVGAHTATHPALSKLPGASQREEIVESKARLEQILNRPVTSFAYPHGDFSTETVNIVREAGFDCACSTRADVVNPTTNRLRLPRVLVPNCNEKRFTKLLLRWFAS